MAEKRKLSSVIKKTPAFHPGGEKGKLHREMGIAEDKKIPEKKLRAAAHSPDAEKRRDAIRAETMKKWHHGGVSHKLYGNKRIARAGGE